MIFDAADKSLTIDQGATFSLAINFETSDEETLDLTSASAAMQGRTAFDAASTIFSLTEVSGITLSDTNPNITIIISAATTAAFTAPHTGVYDLEITLACATHRILSGPLFISPEVTK